MHTYPFFATMLGIADTLVIWNPAQDQPTQNLVKSPYIELDRMDA
jgi:hypothetical protein